MAIEVEVIRRIYAGSGEGAHLEIGDWPEAPDTLELRTADQASKAWFGDTSIVMSPEFAIALGEALIASAYGIKNKENK